MQSLAKTFASPRRVVLDGKSHMLAPLTYGDFAALEQWVRDCVWQALVEALQGVGGPHAEQQRIASANRQFASGEYDVGGDKFAEALSSPAGQQEVVFLMATRGDSSVPEQELRDRIKQQFDTDWALVWGTVQELNGDPFASPDGSVERGPSLTLNEVVVLLSGEPWWMRFDEIERLSPYQVTRVLFCPRDKDNHPRWDWQNPKTQRNVSYRDLFFLTWRNRGETEEQIENRWKQHQQEQGKSK